MNKLTTAILLIISATVYTSAQNLSEEVIIDREITPIVRNTTRPSWVMPSLLSPKVRTSPLAFNEYVGSAEITRSILTLDPVAWADSVMRSPYRGYASIGFFPAFNLGASAGYRFIRDAKTNIGARFSYEGSSWSAWKRYNDKYKQNKLEFGADATVLFNAGKLVADLEYSYSSSDMAYVPDEYKRGTQALSAIDLSASWTPAKTARIGWNVHTKINYGGFTSGKSSVFDGFNTLLDKPYGFEPVKDFNLALGSDLSYKLAEKSKILLDLSVKFRHLNTFATLVPELFVAGIPGLEDIPVVMPAVSGGQTMGIITVSPGYFFMNGDLSGRLGLRADFNTGGFNHKLYVAPDIELRYAAARHLTVFLNAKGGEVMNTNSELWQRDPWMTGVFAVERSHINADVDLGFTFGSYKGFWATMNVGWSSVSDWAVPVTVNYINMWKNSKSFSGVDLGLELGYSWKDLLTVQAKAQGASRSKYYKWQDNARWALDFAAKVRPLKPLQIELGYSARVGRQSFLWTSRPGVTDYAVFESTAIDTGSVSNLFVGAEYEITSAFGAFAKVENLLNNHWAETLTVRSKGVNGLLGVQYKF